MKSPSLKILKFLPLIFFLFCVVLFFYPFFLKNQIPMPADITIGAYFPWLDYKWGTTAGVAIKNPLPSDVPSLTFPNKQLVVQIFKTGHLPDWNKFILSGAELFQTGLGGVFNPTNLVYLFTDFVTGWAFQVLLQPFIALISMYLLARYLKLSKLASCFAAVSFAFSGFLITWVEYNAQSQALALMPLVVYAALKSFDQKNFKSHAFYSLALGLQILSGYPQFVLYTLIFLGVARLFYLRPSFKDLVTFTVFTLFGFSLSALQLFPLFDLYRSSTRLYDAGSLVVTNFGFLPFKHLVTLLSPNFFGNPATLNYTGVGYFDNFSTYPGILALILSFYSLRTHNKTTLVFWLGLGLALLLALQTPLSYFLFQKSIAGFSTAVAARAMSLFTFCLAVLSGIGLNQLISQKKLSAFYFFSFAVLLLLFWIVPGILYLKLRHLSVIELATIQKTTLRNLIVPTAVVTIALIASLIHNLVPKKYRLSYIALFTSLLIAMQFADLFLFGQKYLSFVPRSYIFPTTPIIEYLQKNTGHDRVSGGDVVPMNMLMPYGLKTAAGYEALFSARYATFLGKLRGQDIPSGRVGDIVTYPDNFDFNSTSTKYILAKKYLKGVPDPKGEVSYLFQTPFLKPVFSDGSVQILENTHSLPLIYLQDLNPKAKQITPINQFTESLNGDFDINFENSIKSDLVVATTYSPSWKAILDDKEYLVGTSNNVYISLAGIAPGKHHLILNYYPRTFNAGLVTSLVTLFVLVGLILSRRKLHV